MERRDVLAVQLEDVERKIRSFEKSGYAEILKTYRLFVRQRNEIDRHIEVAGKAVSSIEETADELRPEALDLSAFADDSTGKSRRTGLLLDVGCPPVRWERLAGFTPGGCRLEDIWWDVRLFGGGDWRIIWI